MAKIYLSLVLTPHTAQYFVVLRTSRWGMRENQSNLRVGCVKSTWKKMYSSSNRFLCIRNVRLHKRQEALVWYTRSIHIVHAKYNVIFDIKQPTQTERVLHTARMPSLTQVCLCRYVLWYALHAIIRTIVTIALSAQQTAIKHLSQHNRFKFIKQ